MRRDETSEIDEGAINCVFTNVCGGEEGAGETGREGREGKGSHPPPPPVASGRCAPSFTFFLPRSSFSPFTTSAYDSLPQSMSLSSTSPMAPPPSSISSIGRAASAPPSPTLASSPTSPSSPNECIEGNPPSPVSLASAAWRREYRDRTGRAGARTRM